MLVVVAGSVVGRSRLAVAVAGSVAVLVAVVVPMVDRVVGTQQAANYIARAARTAALVTAPHRS